MDALNRAIALVIIIAVVFVGCAVTLPDGDVVQIVDAGAMEREFLLGAYSGCVVVERYHIQEARIDPALLAEQVDRLCVVAAEVALDLVAPEPTATPTLGESF